jgi:hypothetical protein
MNKLKTQSGGSLEPVGSGLWTVEYEWQGHNWLVTVEAETRESAIERCRRDTPHIIEIRECREAPNH